MLLQQSVSASTPTTWKDYGSVAQEWKRTPEKAEKLASSGFKAIKPITSESVLQFTFIAHNLNEKIPFTINQCKVIPRMLSGYKVHLRVFEVANVRNKIWYPWTERKQKSVRWTKHVKKELYVKVKRLSPPFLWHPVILSGCKSTIKLSFNGGYTLTAAKRLTPVLVPLQELRGLFFS